MVTQIIDTSVSNPESFALNASAAVQLGPSNRIELSLEAIRRTESTTYLAQQRQVSRKFVYKQLGKATAAIDKAFEPAQPKDKDVIFYLPVSKDWIRQFVLSLILICHSSFRGVQDILDTMFDYRNMSLGTIHNIVQSAVVAARAINDSEDLSHINIGDHDEIYQANRPVLVGIDHKSTYCYLLAVEESCDETSWGVHLLDLSQRGLDLERTIADGGKALRAGQKAAWSDSVPCDGDVFHAQAKLTGLATFLERRAYKCINACQDIQAKLGHNYHQIEQSVLEAMSEIPRASSLVENLNSRLRNYFFLRRHIGDDYLDLLRLFLNHHPYMRSDRPERVGKSPAELMTGQSHAHWLEMLGFERFSRN